MFYSTEQVYTFEKFESGHEYRHSNLLSTISAKKISATVKNSAAGSTEIASDGEPW